ncbi:ABC transporter substrate-binding protein [Halorarius halobius]|uniref:ABC transporter substrate-binding protein n=1 Tax=Halorarius halobius TaxID=2962671 RepID=UPI0020CFB068|nr:extracellular solute-binding protein [Halorarius halobius]
MGSDSPTPMKRLEDMYRPLSRRDILALTGTGLSASLAGCTGGDGDGNGNGNGDGNGGGGGGGDGDDSSPTNDDGGSDKTVHIITKQTSDAWQKRWNEEIAKTFQNQSDYKLNVEFAGLAGNATDRLSQLMQAGDPPDTFQYGFEGIITELFGQGALQPTTDVVNGITEVAGDPIPPLFEDTDGDYYEIPIGTYVISLNHRTDFEEKLGLSVPTTWDELKSNAKAISESDEIKAEGMAIPAGVNVYTSNTFWQFLRANGGSIFGWKDRENNELEVTFPKDKVIETLEFFEEMTQYSPDPTNITYSNAIKLYTSGRVGYELFLNAWNIGIAGAVAPEISANSNIAAIPTNDIPIEDLNLLTSCTNATSYYIFENGTAPKGAEALFGWMYGDSLERHVGYNLMEPMRYLPGFHGVLESDAYQNSSYFQENQHHLEINQKLANDILSQYDGPDEDLRPEIPVSEYARGGDTIPRMVNEYLVQGKDVETVYEDAKSEMEAKVEEGREIIL